ncbi:MAG: HlyD family efflux transporter periplasmic adaptor subunit [Pseudomonadota bacterium]
MEIVHESPSPDLSFTVRAPLTLVCDDAVRLPIAQWGLHGFAVDDGWAVVPGAGTLVIPFQGVDIAFPVRLRHDVDQRFVYFEGLTGRQRETLALFYRNLMSGKMAATQEVITSLDTPVDLVPMGETEEEQKQGVARKSPRVVRVLYNAALYVLLSYFVFGILGGSVWSRIDTIDIQHGRLDVPMHTLIAPDTGVVKALHVRAGQAVKAGALLVEVTDATREADVARAALEVQRADAALHEVEAAIADLETALHPDVTLRVRMAKAALHHMTYFIASSYEDMRRQWVELRRTDPEAARDLDPARVTLDRLHALRAVRVAEHDAAQDVLARHVQNARALNIHAQADGQVRDVFAATGSAVRGGTPLVTLSAQTAPFAVGWASERLAETLYVGMPASVGFNVAGTRHSASGKIVDLRAGEDPTRPGEFGIVVTVASDGFADARARGALTSGAPVNLSAEKQLATRALAAGQAAFDWVSGHLAAPGEQTLAARAR